LKRWLNLRRHSINGGSEVKGLSESFRGKSREGIAGRRKERLGRKVRRCLSASGKVRSSCSRKGEQGA